MHNSVPIRTGRRGVRLADLMRPLDIVDQQPNPGLQIPPIGNRNRRRFRPRVLLNRTRSQLGHGRPERIRTEKLSDL